MGKTSNIAKQKWNSAHYVQIKAHIKPEIASAFKAACTASGTTMASELSAFMEEFANPQQSAPLLTKAKAPGNRREELANPQKSALSHLSITFRVNPCEKSLPCGNLRNRGGIMSKEMTQVKFTIEAEIVSAFKARCEGEGVKMTAEIRRFMQTHSPNREIKVKTLTRPQRKKTAREVICILNIVLGSEEGYRDRIPEEFTQRYEAAEHACEQLAEAIAYLEEAF
jgi:uncharacterized protein (DUF4415 family)